MSQEIEIDETLPDVVKSFLRKGAKLQNITLNELGEWKHEGLDFENPKIIGLFNRSVGRTDGGTWVLEIGQFTYPIHVERTGFFVERIFEENGHIQLVLSDGTVEPLTVSSVTYEPDGRLYTRIKDGAFEARFKKPAYYATAEYVEVDEAGHMILALPNGERVDLGEG